MMANIQTLIFGRLFYKKFRCTDCQENIQLLERILQMLTLYAAGTLSWRSSTWKIQESEGEGNTNCIKCLHARKQIINVLVANECFGFMQVQRGEKEWFVNWTRRESWYLLCGQWKLQGLRPIVVRRLGFEEVWLIWIKTCISTTTYSK